MIYPNLKRLFRSMPKVKYIGVALAACLVAVTLTNLVRELLKVGSIFSLIVFMLVIIGCFAQVIGSLFALVYGLNLLLDTNTREHQRRNDLLDLQYSGLALAITIAILTTLVEPYVPWNNPSEQALGLVYPVLATTASSILFCLITCYSTRQANPRS